MAKSYKELMQDLNKALGSFAKSDMPEVMQAFQGLHKAAGAEGALSVKTKELLALGMAVAARCEGCIGFHVTSSLKAGMSREELIDVLAVAVYMGGGPSLMYAAEALRAYEELS